MGNRLSFKPLRIAGTVHIRMMLTGRILKDRPIPLRHKLQVIVEKLHMAAQLLPLFFSQRLSSQHFGIKRKEACIIHHSGTEVHGSSLLLLSHLQCQLIYQLAYIL